MELREVLLKRRSIRKFTAEAVADEQTEVLLHAAMSGPSACNRRPWAFYVVTAEEKLKELRGTTMFTKMHAPLAIVVCGDLRRALPLQLSEYWIQDCSAATENLLLAATDLGLGAVWCGLHPQKRGVDRARKALELDEKTVPLGIVFVGHPDQSPEPRDWYEADRVHYIR